MTSKSPKTWRKNPLVAKCRICDSPADHVKHFGATACYSCRAFFQRTIKNGKEYKSCVRKTDSCSVDAVTRTNCKKCRYQKCLLVGMQKGKLRKNTTEEDDLGQKDNLKERSEQKDNLKERSEQKDNLKERSEGTRRFNDKMHPVQLQCETIRDQTQLQEKVVDIDSLVEECFSENVVSCYESTENVNISGNILDLPFLWTHEEEFKIYELLVNKEMLLDTFFKLIFQFPRYLEAFKKDILSFGCGEGTKSDFQILCDRCPRFVDHNLASDVPVRQSFDMLVKVEEKVKTEVLHFTLPIFRVCLRSIVMGNKDKLGFVEQHISSGIYNNTFKEAFERIIPKNRSTIRSYDPFAIGHFTSPWAVKYDDEVFFLSTLRKFANAMKDDIQLSALFLTLILTTPGAKLTEQTKENPLLKKIQDSVSLLLYRYLRNKYLSSDKASDMANNLFRLLGDLHSCRDIFMFNRLPVEDDQLCTATIQDMEMYDQLK